jgi:hypothetical protein
MLASGRKGGSSKGAMPREELIGKAGFLRGTRVSEVKSMTLKRDRPGQRRVELRKYGMKIEQILFSMLTI